MRLLHTSWLDFRQTAPAWLADSCQIPKSFGPRPSDNWGSYSCSVAWFCLDNYRLHWTEGRTGQSTIRLTSTSEWPPRLARGVCLRRLYISCAERRVT